MHETLGDVLDVVDRHAGQDNREFVAAESAEDVFGPQAETEPVTERLEQGVAGLVPETVVDRLELV